MTSAKDIAAAMKTSAFEKALEAGAQKVKEIQETYKPRKKTLFREYHESMMLSSDKIQQIMKKRKKSRTDSEQEELKKFKALTSAAYRCALDFAFDMLPKDDADAKTKVQKIAEKLKPALMLYDFIGDTSLKDAFKAAGLNIAVDESFIAEDSKKNAVKLTFEDAKKAAADAADEEKKIEADIYEGQLPDAVKFDKDTNARGMKLGDFKKLVTMKALAAAAKDDDVKKKADEKIENAAVDKQLEAARAELMRDALTSIQA